MKKLLLLSIFVFSLIGFYGFSNEDDCQHEVSIVIGGDEKAKFPGGVEKMNTWIKENLRYPNDIKRYGTVQIEFTVKKNGKLSGFTVKKGLEEETDFAAIECLMCMPVWEPAQVEGKKVNSTVVLPIRFARE